MRSGRGDDVLEVARRVGLFAVEGVDDPRARADGSWEGLMDFEVRFS